MPLLVRDFTWRAPSACESARRAATSFKSASRSHIVKALSVWRKVANAFIDYRNRYGSPSFKGAKWIF